MGQNKAEIFCAGLPLLERVIRQLQFTGSAYGPVTLLGRPITASSKLTLDLKFCDDLYPGEGPLGALLTACLAMKNSGWFLFASCDTLNVQAQDLLNLSQHISEPYHAIAYRKSDWEPLWALYHSDIYHEAMPLFQSGVRSLQQLLNQSQCLAVNAQNLDWWQINRPIDLKRAETLLKRQHGEVGPKTFPTL